MMIKNDHRTPKTINSKLKLLLQMACFAVVSIFGWSYLGKKTPTPQDKPPPDITDADIVTLTKTLVLKHPTEEKTPHTKSLQSLGHKLFFDKGFSANGQVACATCHNPELSFTDGKSTSEAIAKTSMNAPTLVNAYAGHWFFWNGRADSLESQAMGPVEHPAEHDFNRIKVAHRIKAQYKKDYENIFGPLPKNLPSADALVPELSTPRVSDEIAAYTLATLGDSNFQKEILSAAREQRVQPIEVIKNLSAFGTMGTPNSPDKSSAVTLPKEQLDAVNTVFANFSRAVAAFERTIRSNNSPFDEFATKLETTAYTKQSLTKKFGEQELRGLKIFAGRGRCLVCHNGPYFTDLQFHNIGLSGQRKGSLDLGRAQGMLMARDNPFNCRGKYLGTKKPTESCVELGYLETENADSVGAFKTPTLRQLQDSRPYGHDGRFASLKDVLHHYNTLKDAQAVGRAEASLRPLGLSEEELSAIEAFLLSLQGDVSYFKP